MPFFGRGEGVTRGSRMTFLSQRLIKMCKVCNKIVDKRVTFGIVTSTVIILGAGGKSSAAPSTLEHGGEGQEDSQEEGGCHLHLDHLGLHLAHL